MSLLVVKLDNFHHGAGPATVIRIVDDVSDFMTIARGDNHDATIRLWTAGDSFEVGDRVVMRFTGIEREDGGSTKTTTAEDSNG